MKKVWRVAAGALLCASIAGCNTASESTFNSVKTRLNNDPDLKRLVIDYCIEDFNHKRLADRQKVAKALGVPESRAAVTGCRRLYGDVTSGKMSYEDYRRWRQAKD